MLKTYFEFSIVQHVGLGLRWKLKNELLVNKIIAELLKLKNGFRIKKLYVNVEWIKAKWEEKQGLINWKLVSFIQCSRRLRKWKLDEEKDSKFVWRNRHQKIIKTAYMPSMFHTSLLCLQTYKIAIKIQISLV